jgi:drug/metabolite transporter (DMT)-like permease
VLVPILVSLAGVALVTRPDLLFGDAASHMKLTGTAVALLGAMLSALAYVAVREASKTEHPLVVIPATLRFISSFVWPQGWQWLLLLGVGVSTQIAQVFSPEARASSQRAGSAEAS